MGLFICEPPEWFVESYGNLIHLAFSLEKRIWITEDFRPSTKNKI